MQRLCWTCEMILFKLTTGYKLISIFSRIVFLPSKYTKLWNSEIFHWCNFIINLVSLYLVMLLWVLFLKIAVTSGLVWFMCVLCWQFLCKQSGQYDAKHFLLYYYYGGMIYTALKNYEQAVFFFENVNIKHLRSFTESNNNIILILLTYSAMSWFHCFFE